MTISPFTIAQDSSSNTSSATVDTEFKNSFKLNYMGYFYNTRNEKDEMERNIQNINNENDIIASYKLTPKDELRLYSISTSSVQISGPLDEQASRSTFNHELVEARYLRSKILTEDKSGFNLTLGGSLVGYTSASKRKEIQYDGYAMGIIELSKTISPKFTLISQSRPYVYFNNKFKKDSSDGYRFRQLLIQSFSLPKDFSLHITQDLNYKMKNNFVGKNTKLSISNTVEIGKAINEDITLGVYFDHDLKTIAKTFENTSVGIFANLSTTL